MTDAARNEPPFQAMPRPRWRLRWLTALLMLLASLTACGTYEDQRTRELWNERGFGSRAFGNATVQEYLGGMDLVVFLMRPEVLLMPGNERLAELLVAQPVALDGTIFVPLVGPVYVLGLTEPEIASVVEGHLRRIFNYGLNLQARIVASNKVFYAIGEVELKGSHLLRTDMTLWDALMVVRWTALANLGRVMLIRPDAEHPLVVDINVRDMFTSGGTAPNIRLRERDTIYVPPTALGLLARILERLLQPVALAVQTVIGAARVQASYEVLSGDVDGAYFRF